MVCMLQGIYNEPKEATISTFILGSEIMEWFSHQNMGNILRAQVTPWKQNINIQMPTHHVISGWEWLLVLFFHPLIFIRKMIVSLKTVILFVTLKLV